MRQALHPGLFIDFTDDFSINSQPIKRVLGITRPDYRMRDVELVIRYFSFKYFITNYEGNLKKAFDSTVKILNENWHNREDEIIEDAENLNTAINLTFDIFGEKEAFSKWANQKFQNNFNRAIFDIMVYYFSNNEIYEIAMTKKEEIKNAFIALCENNRAFVSSFEHTTKSLQNTNIRLTIWGKKLSEILELTIDIPTLNNENRFELINYTHG
ncbi:hypothetical protein ACFOEQ_09820 [Chryseobacterium arachidis]|uniref:hypothetical protein n=1 Tax=Chryseobacterium arachidis TaxID=1416778 RepID=UPI00362163C0